MYEKVDILLMLTWWWIVSQACSCFMAYDAVAQMRGCKRRACRLVVHVYMCVLQSLSTANSSGVLLTLLHLEFMRCRCMKCPVSYHINCIPPDARYHELALLCGDHPEVRPRVLPWCSCVRFGGRSKTLVGSPVMSHSTLRVWGHNALTYGP